MDAAAAKKRLEALREELRTIERLSADDRSAVELDQTKVGRLSRMDALQAQAMAVETERRRKVEIERIGAALKRIDEGTYGDCVSCGEEIAPKRLELDPAVPTCIDCARG